MSRSHDSPGPASPGSLVGNIAEFGNDVATLAELQLKLGALDAKECLTRAAIPLGFMVAGAILALGSVPVVLLGLADLIASSTRLGTGGAQLIVGLVFLAGAGLASALAVRGLLGSLESFRRSNEELVRNISWLRTVLVHSGRSISRPRI